MKRWIAAGCLSLLFMLLFISCSTNDLVHTSPDIATTVPSQKPAISPNPLPTPTGISPKPDQAKQTSAFIICIDPGHQESANDELEADGPDHF